MKILILFIICCLCAIPFDAHIHALEPSPLADLKQFSDFTKIDTDKLLNGEILSERGPATTTNSGISAQFCFFVPASPEETARRLQNWNPLGTKKPGVYSHNSLPSKVAIDDFKKLEITPGYRPMKWLMEKTLATTPARSELNLNRTEGHELSTCVARDSSPGVISACWARILYKRAESFQKNRFNVSLPYELSETESYSPIEQLRRIINEHPRVLAQLGPVLQGSGLTGNVPLAAQLTPAHYWSIYDANHRATLNLGAFFKIALHNRLQLLDVEYYVSGSYYASATLFEIRPFSNGLSSGSLVWRGDYFAAPMLQYTKGIERMAYGLIMIQEIKAEIRNFQKSLKPD